MVDPAPPRVPAHGWAWLQRSRPVLTEIADRLTGGPPTPAFVEELRTRFFEDRFTRDVVVACVADVAFNGRVPRARPAGASWDRGLTWWAAFVAGVSVEEFESRSATQPEEEPPLFDPGVPAHARPGGDGKRPRPTGGRRTAASERAELAARLREVLAGADGDQVPASAIRQLLAALHEAPPPT